SVHVSSAPHNLYTLSLHDALPISGIQLKFEESGRRASLTFRRMQASNAPGSGDGEPQPPRPGAGGAAERAAGRNDASRTATHKRSEEHTSELQSRENLVCRLLLEK